MTNDDVRLHYTCLPSPVYLHLSSFACLPSPVYIHLSSFACVPSPVFLRLSIFASMPLSVYSPHSTLACLPSPVCLRACLPQCLSNFAVYLSLSASQAVFLSDGRKCFCSSIRLSSFCQPIFLIVQNTRPTRYASLVCL